MWVPIILFPLIFILIAFSVTEGNAGLLLSGYNTMTEAQRKNFDLPSYLKFFRGFFLKLGIGLFTGSVLLKYTLGEEAVMIFLVLTPLLCLTGFVLYSQKYSQPEKTGLANYLVSGFLFLVFVSVSFSFYYSLREARVVLGKEELEITGIYGLKLKYNEIETVILTDTMPSIKLKTGGFSMGRYKKGRFKTKDGGSVNLYVNTSRPGYLKMIAGNKLIFWNSDEDEMKKVNEFLNSNHLVKSGGKP